MHWGIAWTEADSQPAGSEAAVEQLNPDMPIEDSFELLKYSHKISLGNCRLEPAGSHGVWGLDDYQFLPFMFGSSQLIAHPDIRPGSMHVPDLLSKSLQDDFLYLSCVGFVLQVSCKQLLSRPIAAQHGNEVRTHDVICKTVTMRSGHTTSMQTYQTWPSDQ